MRPPAPGPATPQIPIGLECYGLSYTCGFRQTLTSQEPLDAQGLVELARELGLAGVSLPRRLFPDGGLKALADLGRRLAEQEMFLLVAGGGTDPERLERQLRAAAAAGSPTLRTVVGGAKIGGDRREIAGRWREFLAESLAGLKAVMPLAEELGVVVAVENHQDLTSRELVELMEGLDSPAAGIQFDTGNALGVGEEPLAFLERIAPYVAGLHLCDYYLHTTPQGYRLVRAPLGDGVVDFPAIFARLAGEPTPPYAATIELGAHEARHVRVMADDFWPGYPPRAARELAPLLRLWWGHAKPPDWEWRTPAERQEDEATILAYERRQLEQSVVYLRQAGLLGGKEGDTRTTNP